jgi:UDP-glucose 4-epimerase
MEMIKAFELASGVSVPYEVVGRRDGDVDACYADPSLAKKLIAWEAKHDITRMCIDAWRWQVMNPFGYGIQDN